MFTKEKQRLLVNRCNSSPKGFSPPGGPADPSWATEEMFDLWGPLREKKNAREIALS